MLLWKICCLITLAKYSLAASASCKFAASTYSFSEAAGSGQVIVECKKTPADVPMDIDISLMVIDNTAVNSRDFIVPNSVRIPGTDTSTTIDIILIDDEALEGPEDFMLAFNPSSSSDVQLLPPEYVVVTIEDNEKLHLGPWTGNGCEGTCEANGFNTKSRTCVEPPGGIESGRGCDSVETKLSFMCRPICKPYCQNQVKLSSIDRSAFNMLTSDGNSDVSKSLRYAPGKQLTGEQALKNTYTVIGPFSFALKKFCFKASFAEEVEIIFSEGNKVIANKKMILTSKNLKKCFTEKDIDFALISNISIVMKKSASYVKDMGLRGVIIRGCRY